MDTIRELGVILDQATDQLANEGMFTGYHAHGFDFQKVSGETAWNHLFSLTKPEVIMQLDTRNCAGGGEDPVAVLEAFPHRVRSLHLGEYGNPENSIIGSGEGEWEKIFHLCENNQNTEWYVVEQGGPDGWGLKYLDNVNALREMGNSCKWSFYLIKINSGAGSFVRKTSFPSILVNIITTQGWSPKFRYEKPGGL